MDPVTALDMERRSGISQQEVDDFAERMDLIAQAMEDVKNGTFDPLQCNIPGYKTPEQAELQRQERAKREEERRRRDEERRHREKMEERDNWWHKAELRYSMRDAEEKDEVDGDRANMSKSERWANRILAAYKARDANDYSLWDQWVPEDPVSLQEKAEREAELEKLRNREFETNNPEFCNQFKKDMEQRQRSQEEKARTAERLKQKGNRLYKKQQYPDAIKSYMEALSASPFNVAVLANIAQCYLRLDQLDDCIEFCTRTLCVDENYVKALSRRATAWHRQKKLKEAAEDMKKAFELDGDNADIVEQHSIIVGDYEDSVANSELEVALNSKRKTGEANPGKLSLGPSSVEELRFAIELLKKMDEQAPAGNATAEGPLQDAWIAYDLLLPFVERNEHVRAKFRTSGEMEKLCNRIVAALDSRDPEAEADSSRQQTEEVTISAMMNCAAAAVADTPRNQKNAVPLLTQVIALANAQKSYHRPTGETTACERLVGNVVKVLIAMQSDHDLDDSKTFRKKSTLAVLVKALQELSDGLARKNVAILLAKLCQSDSQVKDTVRELRGIEMMLSVSQSLKQRPAVLSR
ncbi:uncharacterized protein IUM83_06749 [Phytophthora cinnamomi]|uniref:uncharacterized protein n=1 Tax=Phytophthora cinnamomi TaxID=4785 RepID=UPI00355AC15B|nr:hypothetical protein IUM83_06749 [Phytophthora cinnamomi]